MGAENQVGQLHIQKFLDEISDLDLDPRIQAWYTVDVTAMLGDSNILHHEINDETGCSLLFLPKSIIHFCPNNRKMQHYPKHLVHCFVDHFDENQQSTENKTIFSAEMFSISPCDEHLNWSVHTNSERDIPQLQAKTAHWLRYLNT
tara:strand:+ start:1299 stop:1736 length:438 start_codon:yes stop_codon:yes gene_type:complete